jgi:hypothetical protein
MLMNIAFDSYVAFTQIGWIVSGLFLWVIAVALIGGVIHARRHYIPCIGEIVAVRTASHDPIVLTTNSSPVFYPVVAYTNQTGERVEAETNGGSSNLSNKIPGKKVKLWVRDDNPHIAQISDGSMPIWALFFFLTGAAPVAIGITQYPFNIYTILVFIAFCLWGVFKFSRLIIPRGERGTATEFRQRKAKELLDKRFKMRRMEKEEALEVLAQLDRRFIKGVPVTLLVMIGVLGLGIYMSYERARFMERGIPVEGKIIDMERSHSASSPVYYPVIEYRTKDGEVIRAKGATGSSHPPYRSGDIIKLRYLAEAPDKIMEGEGVLPWILSIGFLTLGLGGLALSIRSLVKARARLRGGHI